MSQAGRYFNGPTPPPAGFVATLTGNTGGAVSPDGASNINVLSDGTTFTTQNEPTGYLFIGNVEANTLTYRAVSYTATTVGATSATLFSLPIAVNKAVTVSAEVVAIRADNLYAGSGFLIGGGINSGAGVVVLPNVDSNMVNNDPTLGGALSLLLTAAGGNIVIGVSSNIVGQTYNWTAFVRYTLSS